MKNRIMATLLAFCMVLALLPGTAMAANRSGTCGSSMTWTLNSAGVLTIRGSGAMTSNSWYPNWYYYRDEITTVVIGNGVNSINDNAFYYCTNLTRVTIPDTVNSIGVRAFCGCNSLPRITIPNSVTSIDWNAFEGCSKLSTITIPDSVTNVGQGIFYTCRALTSVTLPDNFSAISPYMFENCSNLSTLTIPASVTAIGRQAFVNCSNLTSLVIPGGVKRIGIETFKNCSRLKEVAILSSIDTLGDDLFSGCGNLTSVTIPASVDMIGVNVFADCNRLKDIYFAGTQQQWANVYIDRSNDSILSKVTIHYNSGNAAQTQYTVAFNANGGSVNVTEKSVTKGSTYGTLPTPTRTGYTFNGWYTAKVGGTKITSTSKVNLTGNQTLYAQWTQKSPAKTMTVTFNANGGTTATKNKSVTNGSTYGTLPTPTRTGYKFDGWYTTSTGGTKVLSTTKVTKTANHTLYAHWNKIRTFSVTLDANGGTVLDEYLSVTTGARYRHLPTPSRAGYHFNGWYTAKTGGTKITAATQVTNSVKTLYARWGTATPSVKSRQSGSYQIVIPEDYKVLLYNSETTASVAKTAAEQTREYVVTCTKMVKLSNDTVRYYGKFSKVSSSASYWFTFSDEMFIN